MKTETIQVEIDDREWTFVWEWDQDADLSWMTPKERAEDHEVLGCILRDRQGYVLESLWGIVDADRAYGKKIELQLAEEALLGIRAAVFEAI